MHVRSSRVCASHRQPDVRDGSSPSLALLLEGAHVPGGEEEVQSQGAATFTPAGS